MSTTVNPYSETWLARKLDMPRDWDEGDTGVVSRRERVRQYILDNALADTVVGRKGGKPQTASQCFETIYGQSLVIYPEPFDPLASKDHDLARGET